MKDFIDSEYENMLSFFRELCAIPAPSHLEDKRVEYLIKALRDIGAENVYSDEAKNVIFPVNCEGDFDVFAAHTDTVFPDLETMKVKEDETFICAPGAGDDTASVTVLFFTVKYLLQNSLLKDKKVMFVFNSCEEGLGNLKGVRYLFDTYKGRIKHFVSYDAKICECCDGAVGSHRYKVTAATEGGHSFSDFGAANAIAALAKIINGIYALEVPTKEGEITTYNVGTVSGGTSVNTIAQNAEMLCEYRSTDRECLAIMKDSFEKIFADARTENVHIDVELVGERPCTGKPDEKEMQWLKNKLCEANKAVTGGETSFGKGSTDCNIPLSLGVPALCAGVYNGSGAHTREEKVEKASLKTGLEISIKFVMSVTEK